MGPSKGRGGAREDDGMVPSAHAVSVEAIKAVCGGDSESIYHVFKSCNFDVDLTTNTLLDSARPVAPPSHVRGWCIEIAGCEIGRAHV